ncbi:MAG: hydroxyacid dehydrogenase [Acidobacteriota bacterium]|nr:hydroxyacid dehydrogenase [Acidobacteriota bacterium]
MPQNLPKVVVPDDWPPVMAASAGFPRLREFAALEYFDTLPGSEAALIDRIRDAEVVINVRSSSRFTQDVFRQCPGLKLVSLWGTGTDNVDLAGAAKHGVTITNTPGVSAFSVAEHALALMLAAARTIPAQDAAVRGGAWPRGQGIELRGKTLGIVGLGAIGRRFAELGQAIGMRVVAWTMHPNPGMGIELTELDELLRSSDVVSIHVRLSPQTTGLIGTRQFGLMKPSALLINTARGAIVEEAALVDALGTKRIAGAGLDVFTSEPLPPGHPLTQLPNVVLTPHSAGITPEALEAGLQMAIENVWSFLAGNPANVVVRT